MKEIIIDERISVRQQDGWAAKIVFFGEFPDGQKEHKYDLSPEQVRNLRIALECIDKGINFR